MSGVHYSVDLKGIAAALHRFEGFAGANRAEMMDLLGAVLESSTRNRIRNERTSPDGTLWPEWSETYSASRHDGHSLLMNSGTLEDSIARHSDAHGVEIGSNLVYAAVHQFGGSELSQSNPAHHIPARPFLGVSDADIAMLSQVASEWMEAQIR